MSFNFDYPQCITILFFSVVSGEYLWDLITNANFDSKYLINQE